MHAVQPKGFAVLIFTRAGRRSRRGAINRWTLLVIVLALPVGAAGGFYAASLTQPSPPRAVNDRALSPARKAPAEQPNTPASRSAPLLPDPAATRPRTVSELKDELSGILAHAEVTFPDSADRLEMQARIQDWLGNTDEAERLREQCLKGNPEYAYAYYGLAKIAEKRGDSRKAAELALKAVAIEDNLLEARLTAAESLLNAGQPQRALELLQQEGSKPRSAHELLLLGQGYLQSEQYESAIEYYQAALDEDPQMASAWYGLSQAYARLGQQHQAQEALANYRQHLLATSAEGMRRGTAAVDLQRMLPAAVVFYIQAGRLYAAADRLAEAEQLWRRAAVLDPADSGVPRELARLYRASGKPREELRQLQQLVELHPQDPALRLMIGEVYASLQRLDETEKSLRQAAELAPDTPQYIEALTVFYIQTDRNPAEALTLARRVVELDPKPSNYALLATAAYRSADVAGALQAINRALELDPQNPKYHQMRGVIQSASSHRNRY